jgi:hypothetical protein
VPSKINPNDWDTFFSSSGPRRSGPLGVFVRTVVVLAVVGGIAYGLSMFNAQLQAKKAVQEQTTLALAPTRTALAFANMLERTAQAQPTAKPNLPTGRVLAQAPLRKEPNEGSGSSGLVNPNDSIYYIESRDVEGQLWWNIQLNERANTAIEGAEPGAQGWVPASSVTQPSAPPPTQPVPVAEGSPVPPSLPPVTLNGAQLNLYRDPKTSISVSRDPRWNPQGLPTLSLGIFLAPAVDSGEGVIAAKVIDQAQDQNGYLAAVGAIANLLAKPGTQPALSPLGTGGQGSDGIVTLVRSVGGQDITVKGRYLAKPAPGNSVGVVLAFVPENSYTANEGVLNQIIQGVIFQ